MMYILFNILLSNCLNTDNVGFGAHQSRGKREEGKKRERGEKERVPGTDGETPNTIPGN